MTNFIKYMKEGAAVAYPRGDGEIMIWSPTLQIYNHLDLSKNVAKVFKKGISLYSREIEGRGLKTLISNTPDPAKTDNEFKMKIEIWKGFKCNCRICI